LISIYLKFCSRFLLLILFSSVLDYLVGIGLIKNENVIKRKLLLLASIIINLVFLGFFKYYNFFVDNFLRAFVFFGKEISIRYLTIILPVGISFYTFQTLSYSMDVYKKNIIPTKDFVAFAAFVSFFPQLVAGPIERATNLLPQFYKERKFDYANAVDGCKQMLWGFFQKIVIADTCAQYADMIFSGYSEFSGLVLLFGAFFFAIQIYGDFSGYSDIAIGVSRLFGFSLMQNFSFPYFSRDIAEFWRRWHISLTTWFRDYVYIPLGGSRKGILISIRNTFIIFLISGFWHGARWTFVIWGLLNALYFLPLLITKNNRKNIGTVAARKYFPTIKELLSIIITFLLTSFAWILFRSESVSDSIIYISRIFTTSFFTISPFVVSKGLFFKIFLIIPFVLIEWIGRENLYAIENIHLNKQLRWLLYYGILACIILFSGVSQSFIYFQF
jgi:D-alanyl-lipoteichoic acid acyltransferase DltB (MBOAT superfamily)